MQFYIEPEVSWTKWFHAACFTGNTLTNIGEYLLERLQGATFIDVPCGLRTTDAKAIHVLAIARALGVTTFIEVDNSEEVLKERLERSGEQVDGCTVLTLKADILEYCKSLPTNKSKVARAIYISGLQPDQTYLKQGDNEVKVVVPYINALYSELERVTNSGDIVIINDVETLTKGVNEIQYPNIHASIALPMRNFNCVRRCRFGKVYVFEKL